MTLWGLLLENTDALREVFTFLDQTDHFSLRLTCQEFKNVSYESVRKVSFKNYMRQLHHQNEYKFITQHCPYLQEISTVSITDDIVIEQMQELSKLIKISLARCNSLTKGGLELMVTKFPNLEDITLSRYYDSLVPLQKVKKLTSLTLCFTRSDLCVLSKFTNLKKLDLTYSTSMPPDLSTLSELESLNLSNIKLFGGLSLQDLGLASLKNLKVLDLKGTSFRGIGLLKNMNLSKLDLSYSTPVTHDIEDFHDLWKSLPELTELKVNSLRSMVTQELMIILEHISWLKELHCSCYDDNDLSKKLLTKNSKCNYFVYP